MFVRRLSTAIATAAVAAACGLAGAPMSAPAASPTAGRVRVAVSGAVRRVDTDLRACDLIGLARGVHVLALELGPGPRGLLSVRIPLRGALRAAPVGRWRVIFSVPRDRNWGSARGRGEIGTVSAVTGGRAGTIHAELPATVDGGTRENPRGPAVHIDARWSCAHLRRFTAVGS